MIRLLLGIMWIDDRLILSNFKHLIAARDFVKKISALAKK